MTESPESTNNIPLLMKMHRVIARGESLLSRDRVPPGPALSVCKSFRAKLLEIYGNDSQLPEGFLAVPFIPTAEDARSTLSNTISSARRVIKSLEALSNEATSSSGARVFIGHGRSPLWRELKDFLAERLNLPWDEWHTISWKFRIKLP